MTRLCLAAILALASVTAHAENKCNGVLHQQQCQESKPIVIMLGYKPMPYEIKVDRIRTIDIGDSNVVDVMMLDDRSFILRPLQSGKTNILILDEDNQVIRNLSVIVRGETVIYNKKGFGSQQYHCWESGCTYTGETHYQLPAQVIENHNYIH